MARQWTAQQQQAIENRGGTLLVSAAAGSGKTAVLTERVVRRLTDPTESVEISELLLVTFTHAAAAEMRERIVSAIASVAAQHPEDTRLRRQMLLARGANIMTVHAFCLQLIRDHASLLGLSPDFRLMNEKEGNLLRAEVLEEVLEEQYAAGGESFLRLSDLLTSGQSDKRLGEVVQSTFARIQSHPDPLRFLERVRRGLYAADMNTPQGELLLHLSLEAAKYGLQCIERAITEMTGEEALEKAYLPAFTSDQAMAKNLIAALRSKNWQQAYQAAQAVSFDRLGAARGFEDKDLLEDLKALRQEWKDTVKRIAGQWICVSEEDALADRARTAPAMEALLDTVIAFSKALSHAKRLRNGVDFNDLEHFSVQLLYTADGEKSEIAKSVSARFAEILVDEYQDTNAVQDAIFSALSKEDRNLFFVGDVKQSIYGFRLANPAIFLKKYLRFADAEQAQQDEPRRVVLDRNFRSRGQVLSACNYIFSSVMGDILGGMQYTEREALHLGADYPEAQETRYRTEVLLLEFPSAREEEEMEKTEYEAQQVAQRIRRMIDEGFPVMDSESNGMRPLRADDVAILLRSPKGRAETFTAALEAVGLRGQAEESGGLLYTSEVSTVVSLLSVIDNPRQDVDLIGAMRSPLLGFSEEELAKIRASSKKTSFYDAVLYYAKQDEKTALFVQQLDSLREFARDMPVYRLIWKIYDDTGALGLYGAWPDGRRRQSNLLAFFERARAFEAQDCRGLFRFVHFLRGMLETDEDFPVSYVGGAENAVHVLSIHKSKGLEFPAVFLCDCGKKMNDSDLREPVLVDSGFGIACKCRDRDRGIEYDTAERIAVSAALRLKMVSEELRVLYVAMTRAKEKLILTCASASLSGMLQKCARMAQMEPLPQYALGMSQTPLSWLLTPLLRHPASRALRQRYDLSVPEAEQAPDVFELTYLPYGEEPAIAPETRASAKPEQKNLPVVHGVYQYPYAFLKDIPSKLTATGIGRGYRADEAAEQAASRLPATRQIELRAPAFFLRDKKLTPAQIGTAHHLFLQFCRFDKMDASDGVEQELARLRDTRILSPEQAQAVDPEKIRRFFNSSLYRERMVSARVRREFKFSVCMPAATYFPVAEQTPEEKILLQGVIDCLIETPEGFLVLDFKTDRVSAEGAPRRAEQYRAQLDAYADAVRAVFDRPVCGSVLYFLSCGEEVWLKA